MRKSAFQKAAAALSLAITCFVASAGVARAQCDDPRKADGSMSEPVYRAVEQVNKLLSENKNDQAIEQLRKLGESKMTPYEAAIVYYNLGFAYNLKDDGGKAVDSFQKALDQNALPQAQHEQLLYNTGQLYVINKQIDKGISTMERYMVEACGDIPADAHVFLASAYAEKKRYREALKQIDQALLKTDKPKESWLQTKLAIHFELEDYESAADTLVRLMLLGPQKADYWKQLSSIFIAADQNLKAAATLSLAERQGFIDKPGDYKNLYSLYMSLDVPQKAAQLYKSAMAAGRIPRDEANQAALADAWINAKELAEAEKILKPLAESSDKGDYYYKLGAIYSDQERWPETIDMLKKATARSLKPELQGESWLRLAAAYYGQKDLKAAESALVKAAGYDRTRKQASEWLNYLRSSGGA